MFVNFFYLKNIYKTKLCYITVSTNLQKQNKKKKKTNQCEVVCYTRAEGVTVNLSSLYFVLFFWNAVTPTKNAIWENTKIILAVISFSPLLSFIQLWLPNHFWWPLTSIGWTKKQPKKKHVSNIPLFSMFYKRRYVIPCDP